MDIETRRSGQGFAATNVVELQTTSLSLLQTTNNSIRMNIVNQSLAIASDPKQARWVASLLLTAEAALCALII